MGSWEKRGEQEDDESHKYFVVVIHSSDFFLFESSLFSAVSHLENLVNDHMFTSGVKNEDEFFTR